MRSAGRTDHGDEARHVPGTGGVEKGLRVQKEDGKHWHKVVADAGIKVHQ